MRPALAASFANAASAATSGPLPAAGFMQLASAVCKVPCAQWYGPPAMKAAPATWSEKATCICSAMYAPEDRPDTVVRAASSLSFGSGVSSAWTATGSAMHSAMRESRGIAVVMAFSGQDGGA